MPHIYYMSLNNNMTQKSVKNKIIIGNWKMNKGLKESRELAGTIIQKFKNFNFNGKEVVICPDFVSLTEIKKMLEDSKVGLGAQDAFWEASGSYTGEVSPRVLAEAGCDYVIIGHSERRKYLLENYAMIHQETKAILDTNITPIVCIGEEAEDRKTDKRDFVLINQLQQALGGVDLVSGQRVIVAYEPVWAIGSGTAIEPEEASYAHKIIKLALNDLFGIQMAENNFHVIYGGSVTSKNIKQFSGLEGVDGLLIGGASLEAGEFYKICEAM